MLADHKNKDNKSLSAQRNNRCGLGGRRKSVDQPKGRTRVSNRGGRPRPGRTMSAETVIPHHTGYRKGGKASETSLPVPGRRELCWRLAAAGRPARMGLEGSSFRAATSTPSLTKQQPTHTHVKSDRVKSESESQLLPVNNGNHHHGYRAERQAREPCEELKKHGNRMTETDARHAPTGTGAPGTGRGGRRGHAA
jgi:hypothetical protein